MSKATAALSSQQPLQKLQVTSPIRLLLYFCLPCLFFSCLTSVKRALASVKAETRSLEAEVGVLAALVAGKRVADKALQRQGGEDCRREDIDLDSL